MAGKDAIVSPNPQFHISRHQFDALLASHKAFHDVAIMVTDILRDPSRTSRYQSLPNEAEDAIDVNYIDYQQDVSEGDGSVTRPECGRVTDDGERYIPHQQERKPVPDKTVSNFTFEVDNMRARKAYRQKRQRSINLYATTSVSYLETEYDFQCKPASGLLYFRTAL